MDDDDEGWTKTREYEKNVGIDSDRLPHRDDRRRTKSRNGRKSSAMHETSRGARDIFPNRDVHPRASMHLDAKETGGKQQFSLRPIRNGTPIHRPTKRYSSIFPLSPRSVPFIIAYINRIGKDSYRVYARNCGHRRTELSPASTRLLSSPATTATTHGLKHLTWASGSGETIIHHAPRRTYVITLLHTTALA